ncbi:MAG TPA: iron-containing alcohol dehydrogenase [Thermoleophilaceae bacterium]|nr:iron-containing alcohol dehydrogenase [Thermoleophilaceae bacterium]
MDFTWVDGERLVRFGAGVVDEASSLLASRGFDGYALLTTERAVAAAPALAGEAAAVLHVPAGSVPDIAAAVLPDVGDRPLVALGGGRVVDAAKAVAGVERLPCAAVPTTLAGSPMTPFHRLPAGTRGGSLVRPSVVVWDPELAGSLAREQLVATGMNALAHAFESLYVPHANPVAEMAALRAASLFGEQLQRESPNVMDVALAALLAGYAVGTTGFAIHHALCQTTVRVAGLPHANVNAVVLPHSAAFMAGRAPDAVGRFAAALGEPGEGDGPAAAAVRSSVARLTAETGVEGLAELGLDASAIPGIAHAAVGHPAIGNTPGGPPDERELAAVLTAAL